VSGAGKDREAPVGEYKKSGNGREWGEIAFGEFLKTTIVVQASAPHVHS
jgi:aldehyde dehydrogenase (NAD+)